MIAVILLFSAGCQSQTSATLSAAEQSQAEEVETDQTLIVYYSYSGKTKAVAELLAEKTWGDLFEIQVVAPYPEDMYETSDRAEQERESGNLPELNGTEHSPTSPRTAPFW